MCFGVLFVVLWCGVFGVAFGQLLVCLEVHDLHTIQFAEDAKGVFDVMCVGEGCVSYWLLCLHFGVLCLHRWSSGCRLRMDMLIVGGELWVCLFFVCFV